MRAATALAILLLIPSLSSQAGPASAPEVSLFTALHEQFGSRLERARAPRDVVIIDAVERPTPN